MQDLVIYSGQARTFKQTVNSHWFRLLRHLNNPTVIVSVAADEQATDMGILERLIDHVHMEFVQQPTVKEPEVMPGMLGMYPPSTDAQGILRQLWSLNRAWEFAQEKVDVALFDRVIRIRPDLALDRVVLHGMILPQDCYTPWWACWGGVNDRLAFMGPKAAPHYFGTWKNLDHLISNGCPLHPETLIASSLRRGYVDTYRTLEAEFVTLRLDGSVVPMSITATDLAYYRRGE